VALVTGAARGIGRAVTAELSRRGWSVVAVDRDDARVPGAERSIAIDLAQADAGGCVLRRFLETHRRLDALINNAAEQLVAPLMETSLEDWNRIFACNVSAPFQMTQAFAPLLKAQRGAIVNVVSVHALATSPQMSAYAASKGALLSWTRSAALELAPEVRVNAVLPGATDTPMLRDSVKRSQTHLPEAAMDRLRASHPLGRVAEPSEIARVVRFLADAEDSAFVTGQALVVDGGALARLSTE
jgi:NAD(P)-dependent dehydrogenase (short-subunit alcohol dehydrogenase family)